MSARCSILRVVATYLLNDRASNTFGDCDFSHGAHQSHGGFRVLFPLFERIESPDSLDVTEIALGKIGSQASNRPLCCKQYYESDVFQ
jgi:hypothetical protein